MSKQERALLLKFISGDSRLKADQKYDIRFGEGKAGLPWSSTCTQVMYVPYYETKEETKQKIIAAITLCGEIDLDGDARYGSEQDSDEEERHRNQPNHDAEDNDSDQDINLVTRVYPMRIRDPVFVSTEEQVQDWDLRFMDRDDR